MTRCNARIETLRRAGMLVASGDAPVSLGARFFQVADDPRAVGGGVVADAADAAGDLRAASMRGRTSRCERPNAGQTLALLSAVALGRASLSPADAASVETLPPTYPANADAREAETSDEHLTDAANGIRVRVDGHGPSTRTRRWTPTDPTDPDGSDGSDGRRRTRERTGRLRFLLPADGLVSVADAAAAARDAGPGGSPSELATRTGASVASCEAALRAARDAETRRR